MVVEADRVSSKPRTGSDHIAELDGIRAFAILSVLATHLLVVTPTMQHMPSGLPHVVDVVLAHGWLGVDLFFVLSGFLITRILLATRERGTRAYYAHFYRRRALRILPLYLVVLAVLFAAYAHAVGPAYFAFCLAFAANLASLFGVAIPNGGGPLWSLAVEEQFYLIWPVLVLALNRRSLFYVLLAVVIGEPILRFLFVDRPIELTWFRCDGLATGALVALWSTWEGRGRVVDDRIACGLVALGVAIALLGLPFGGWAEGPVGHATRISEALCAFAALVVFGVSRSGTTAAAWLRSRFFRVTAELSFCLYLVHVPLIDAYDALAPRLAPRLLAMSPLATNLVRAVVVLVAAYAVAAVSRRYLEVPFTNRGRTRRIVTSKPVETT